MPAQCSRIDCDEPAVALFAFDATAALVWLEPFEGGAKGAGLLCAHHADTLTPIRGWTLRDRRVRAPRLWVDRPDRVRTEPARSPRPARVPAPSHLDPAPLPFTERDPAPRDEDAADLRAEVHTRADVDETDEVDDFDEFAPDAEIDRWLSARTPLLARAFAATRALTPRH
jgi:hypothetical protein